MTSTSQVKCNCVRTTLGRQQQLRHVNSTSQAEVTCVKRTRRAKLRAPTVRAKGETGETAVRCERTRLKKKGEKGGGENARVKRGSRREQIAKELRILGVLKKDKNGGRLCNLPVT